jgi:hypothetical protein
MGCQEFREPELSLNPNIRIAVNLMAIPPRKMARPGSAAASNQRYSNIYLRIVKMGYLGQEILVQYEKGYAELYWSVGHD